MPAIDSFRIYSTCRERASKLATSYGEPTDSATHVIVQLSTSEGLSGWGEATPLPMFTGETAESIRQILAHDILPPLRGMDSEDVNAIHDKMANTIYGNTSSKAAVDMAIHDLTARSLRIPEYVLLGGKCNASIGVNRHIGITGTEKAVSEALRFVDDGYMTLKMKAGRNPGNDIERIRAVREAVGSDIAIRVDFNQGYDFSAARRVIGALRDAGIQYFEQPLPRHDFKGLKALREATGAHLGADESLSDIHDAIVLAENGCVDVFVIKLIKMGGLKQAREIAAVAGAFDIQCVVTSVFDTQVGAAHCLQLAAALPNVLSCDLTCFASQPAMAKTCHLLSNGSLVVGGAAGCGVESIDEIGQLC